MSLEELAKLRNEARAEHVAAREARAAYSIEAAQRLANSVPLDDEFVRRGEALTAAAAEAQARLRAIDKRHLNAFKEVSRPR